MQAFQNSQLLKVVWDFLLSWKNYFQARLLLIQLFQDWLPWPWRCEILLSKSLWLSCDKNSFASEGWLQQSTMPLLCQCGQCSMLVMTAWFRGAFLLGSSIWAMMKVSSRKVSTTPIKEVRSRQKGFRNPQIWNCCSLTTARIKLLVATVFIRIVYFLPLSLRCFMVTVSSNDCEDFVYSPSLFCRLLASTVLNCIPYM